VSGGVRYISEDRAATAAQNNLTIFTDTNQFARCAGTDLDASGLVDQANEFAGGAGFRICSDVSGKETDKDVTFNGNLQYRPIDGTMLYASFATGFKAGGFNLVSGLTQQIASTTFSFEPETTTNYELGGRHEIDVGAADLVFNWTFYRLEIEDQQVSSNDPVIIAQRVTNAAEYLNAPCFTGQTAAQGCVGGVQDRSGTDITNAPEWQGTGNLSYEFVLGNGMTLTPFAELEYRDGFFTDVDLDPRSIQDSFVKLNASITLAADDERWNIALVGRNLTDEIVQTFSGPTTAVNAFGGGGFYAFSEPGRTIALRGRFNF
jgi:outer membrane receptor protein involved in Fe transport